MSSASEGQARASQRFPKALTGGGSFMLPMGDSMATFVKTYQQGTMAEKVETAHELLRCGEVWPRDCPRWSFAG